MICKVKAPKIFGAFFWFFSIYLYNHRNIFLNIKMNLVKMKISKIISQSIFELYNITWDEIKLENPPKKELWDYAFGCFILSKTLGKNPAVIANELMQKLLLNVNFSEISTAWPFLNIKMSYKFYTDIFLNEVSVIPNIWEWKTVVIDYIWANVWKTLHIGHMCTPNQWQVTINIYKLLWYNVIWDSHLWDWGIIFGKLILAYKLWGDESKLQENAVDYLLELYIKITAEIEKDIDLESKTRQEFKLLSQGDLDSIELWQKFTRYSIDAMQIHLNRLWVQPDYDIWESFYEGIWLPKMGNYPDLKFKMSDIVKELIDKKIAIKNEDGSVWVLFDDKIKIPSCVLAKRDGTHLYFTSDLAAIKYRITNWNPSKIIYHTDIRQELHFKQAFEIAKNAQWLSDTQLIHAPNGFISLKDWAMSSRKGNIIKLWDLLDEAKIRAKKIVLEKRNDLQETEIDEISEIIGIGAIKYGYLSKSRITDVIFDWDEFMSFEWNSFPYVAYSYVRALRLLEKSGLNEETLNDYKNIETFETYEEIDLLKEISSLNEILIFVHDNILAHSLVNYVYNLSKKFSAFYNVVHILKEENEDKKILRLKLITKYLKTQKLIFEILAIKLPIKM